MGIDAGIPLGAIGRQQSIDPFQMAQSLSSMQVQRENAAALQEQRALASEQRRRAIADSDALDAAVKPGVDVDGILANLPGHMHAAVREQFGKADKANADAQEARAKADAAESDYFGTLAASVLAWEKDGPEAVQNAAGMAIQHAKANGHDTSQIEGLLKQNPNALPQVLQSLVQASPKQRELLDRERGTGAQVQNAATTADKFAIEKPGLVADAAIKQQVAAGTVAGLTPEQQRMSKDREANTRIAAGNLALSRTRETREQAKYDQTYGSGVDEQGKPLPENPRARAIAEYREPGFMGRAGASGPGNALMAQVYKINPGYDATQFPARNRMRTAFTSGAQGQQINAMNTAIGHLGLLGDMTDALKNGSFKPGNAIYQQAQKVFGSSAPTNFDTLKEFLDGELGAVVKKGAATEGEMNRLKENVGRSSSPDQLAGYVQTAVGILGGKLDALDYQYKQTMGEKDPFSPLSPESKAFMQKYGKGGSAAGQLADGTQKPIPGVPGGLAEFRGGKWIRVK